jgi:hypothetical protein
MHLTGKAQSERIEKDIPNKWSLKVSRSILISDRADFKPKLARRSKEGHLVLIKGTSHQDDRIIVNKYICIYMH